MNDIYDRLDRIDRALRQHPAPRIEHQLFRARWRLLAFEEHEVKRWLAKVNP